MSGTAVNNQESIFGSLRTTFSHSFSPTPNMYLAIINRFFMIISSPRRRCFSPNLSNLSSGGFYFFGGY